jgi:hypothetical protein
MDRFRLEPTILYGLYLARNPELDNQEEKDNVSIIWINLSKAARTLTKEYSLYGEAFRRRNFFSIIAIYISRRWNQIRIAV